MTTGEARSHGGLLLGPPEPEATWTMSGAAAEPSGRSLKNRAVREPSAAAAPAVLTFGEALVGYGTVEDNLRLATRFTRFPGGADLNVAVGLTRLGTRATWAAAGRRSAR